MAGCEEWVGIAVSVQREVKLGDGIRLHGGLQRKQGGPAWLLKCDMLLICLRPSLQVWCGAVMNSSGFLGRGLAVNLVCLLSLAVLRRPFWNQPLIQIHLTPDKKEEVSSLRNTSRVK